jgi:hypothetical protein
VPSATPRQLINRHSMQCHFALWNQLFFKM